MKKLALTALALGGILATGCGNDMTVRVEWELRDGRDLVTCASENASTIRVTTVNMDTNTQNIFDFPCVGTNGTVETFGLPPDDYAVTVELVNGVGAVISDPVDYVGANCNSSGPCRFGVITFQFAPPNQVVFDVQYGNVGSTQVNCDSGGGAGVAQQEVSLYLSGAGTCDATNYVLDVEIGTDANTCTTPALCQDRLSDQYILNIQPGDYDLVVEGLKSAVAGGFDLCYSNDVVNPFSFTKGAGFLDLGTVYVAFDPPLPRPSPDPCEATKR